MNFDVRPIPREEDSLLSYLDINFRRLQDLLSVAGERYTQDIGDGAATSFTIQHNLGTRDVLVQVRENAAPYATVQLWSGIERTTIDSLTVTFSTAPTLNQYRVIVFG